MLSDEWGDAGVWILDTGGWISRLPIVDYILLTIKPFCHQLISKLAQQHINFRCSPESI